MYDVLIVGGGPMGIALGVEAKKKGLRFLLVEKGALVNALYHFPQRMTFFSTAEKLEIGEVPFVSIQDRPTRAEALEYYRRVVQKWKLPFHLYEEVVDVQQKEEAFLVQTLTSVYQAKAVVLATGFYGHPKKMNVLGEDLPKVQHYYREAHPYIGQKVAVIGGANSAAQVALELHYKGADVTLLVRELEISTSVKYWIKPNLENRIKEGSIHAYFNASVEKITEDSICFVQEGKAKEVPNDFVFAMTGYLPDYAFLKKIGVEIQSDDFATPVHDDAHETNIPSLYLAGVLCGGRNTSKYFIENTRAHAQKIIESIKAKED